MHACAARLDIVYRGLQLLRTACFLATILAEPHAGCAELSSQWLRGAAA